MDSSSTLPTTRTLAQILAPVAGDLEAVESILGKTVRSEHPMVQEMVDHSQRFAGKRLRPALTLLAGRCSGTWDHEIPSVAAVVEMIHTATLVHDDVLDDAKLRRRVASCNGLYGNEGAVLLGDYLFATAFALSASLENRLASRFLARITAEVCEGEILQNRERGNLDLPEDRYFTIIEKKTAILYAAAGEVGARYAGADEASVQALRSYGLGVGLAFQIVDDCLDVDGDEGEVGKSLGTDVAKGKMTLPVIHFLRSAEGAARDRMVEVLSAGEAEGAARNEARDLLREHGSIEFAMDRAGNEVRTALEGLGVLQSSAAVESLHELAEYVLTRTR
ncbi:MAG: polyprenyl synthetase family protein [Planctomycetota bacterium]